MWIQVVAGISQTINYITTRLIAVVITHKAKHMPISTIKISNGIYIIEKEYY